MRIAVLIYGRLNKCAEHYNNILNSIGNHDIDFFLSSDNSSENLLNEFIHLYKPICYTNEIINHNYNINNYPNRRPEMIYEVCEKMIRHFINKSRVFLLLENYINTGIHYDCVVSLRIDCVFQNNFVFDNLEDNTIYIPNCYDYVHNGINDQIAYGKINTMKKYNSIINNMIYLLDNNLSIFHPESLNYSNIQYNKLTIERVNILYYLEK
jgi:hypothetical protein